VRRNLLSNNRSAADGVGDLASWPRHRDLLTSATSGCTHYARGDVRQEAREFTATFERAPSTDADARPRRGS